jgi:D-tyrosyl-tRNA(Tyr) deacylase
MRALLQRVSKAQVTIEDKVTGSIEQGILVLLGVKQGDETEDAEYLAGRVSTLRIFNDGEGKMNLSVKEVGGKVLVISQFTLHANTRKGNRPSYTSAADPRIAEKLYKRFIAALRKELGSANIKTGMFRAMMQVELVNDGPVTILLKSKSEYKDHPPHPRTAEHR